MNHDRILGSSYVGFARSALAGKMGPSDLAERKDGKW